MSKVTKSIRVSLTNTRANMFLFALMCCTFVSFGQLKVNSNTVFTANTVVSSKEEVNIFESSVLGNDALLLNGSNQILETAENTSLHTLHVANANELSIKTDLKLRGNLVVKSGVLHLEKRVIIEGEVILENDAVIPNQHLIIYKNKYVFHKEFTHSSITEIATASTMWIEQFEKYDFYDLELQLKPIIILNDFIKNQYLIIPFSPPPEMVA